jgi:hypothetical protein
MVDYALRRRFGFVSLEPILNSEGFSSYLLAAGVAPDLLDRIVKQVGALNEEIRKDRNLGRGFEIGHSYFIPDDTDGDPEEHWYQGVLEHEIRPLLEEYWPDDSERVDEILKKLR